MAKWDGSHPDEEPKRKKTQAIRPETSTQKNLRQKNYEEGEKVTQERVCD
jgi:hypothetical protein